MSFSSGSLSSEMITLSKGPTFSWYGSTLFEIILLSFSCFYFSFFLFHFHLYVNEVGNKLKKKEKKEANNYNSKRKEGQSIKTCGCNSIGFGGLFGMAPCRKRPEIIESIPLLCNKKWGCCHMKGISIRWSSHLLFL